jgi:hypothetical protein
MPRQGAGRPARRKRSEAEITTASERAVALGEQAGDVRRHVQPYVRCVYSGQLRLYRPRDLERWADDEASTAS